MRDPRELGRSARSVVRGIDEEIKSLERREKALAAERQRLLSARAALTGRAGAGPSRGRRITQDDVAAYLSEHPGSWPAQIADALDVPVTNVSTHLYRGKRDRFERRADGWHVHSRGGSDAR
jgi:hypothetical protein